MRTLLSGIGLLIVAVTAVVASSQEPHSSYSETISVVRYIIDVRVTDAGGNAFSQLSAGDFVVTVAGKAAVVESAMWIGENERALALPDSVDLPEASATEPRGRLVVFYVNSDFGRNVQRIKGQMKFNGDFVERVFAMLEPDDRVAVLSFDSHLKLRCDFTSDHGAALEAVRRSIAIEAVPLPEPAAAGLSLARHLDAGEMKKAARVEEGLLLIARALRYVDGVKLMIMSSWGLGDRSFLRNGTVTLPREWNEAVGILRRDHVPVVSVLTGLGGQLSVGVAQTARMTGGVFASAVSDFPSQSLTRIEGFLSGFYELTLRLEEPLDSGEHSIDVVVNDRKLRVTAAPLVVVDPTDVLYFEAVELFNAGQTDVAVAVLRESVASEPVPTNVMVDRLRALTDAHQWQGALVVLEAIEGMGAVDQDVATMRAEATKGLLVETQGVALDRLTKARQQLLDGSTDGVEELLDEAITLEPLLADAWHERGMLRLSTGDVGAAKSDLMRYLELQPRGRHAADVRGILANLAPEGGRSEDPP
jgi:hypothetical protein